MHHFLKETDFTREQAQHVFQLAKQFKTIGSIARRPKTILGFALL